MKKSNKNHLFFPKIKNTVFLFIVFIFCFINISCSNLKTNSDQPHVIDLPLLPTSSLSEIDFAIQKLKQAGISEYFMNESKSILKKITSTKDGIKEKNKIIQLNIFGFTSKADYSIHYSKRAINSCSNFIKKHHYTFLQAEKKFGVSKESIASLLWVETKHGRFKGTEKILFVYLSLLLANHPFDFSFTEKELNEQKKEILRSNPQFNETLLQKKILERSVKKANWALEQLKAIDQLFASGFKSIFSLHSSYAGAFGMPQFIPTTYLKFSYSLYRNKPNLDIPSDAILSVANYLNKSGWSNEDEKSKINALYEYNHSKDYGAIILKIASELE